ncbi:MAG: glycosyltransferase family 4 protein [Pelolinea sp.]|nr:glycosyltransferase family 4 protein [Pelolinea sp.]
MKIILFANTDWYLYNYRLPLAHTLHEKGHELLLLSPAGKYASQIQASGFRWQALELSRSGINPVSEISTILRLARLYRREKPDLVHHFTSKCVLYGSLAARMAGARRVVNAVTGMGYVFTRKNLLTFVIKPFVILLYKIVLRDSRVIFQNQQDLDFFTAHHLVDADLCKLIPGSGVDIKKFKPMPQPDGVPLVVLPARMIWDKGISEFVEAATAIKQKGIKARFALVGTPDKGNPASISEEQLESWAASGLIEAWGWQEDMVLVYQQASVVCLPSYREGLAKSLIEAAACGRALVASDIPGCREVVRDGVNGFVVPPKQAGLLAEALEKIICNKELRGRMGVESRKIVEREFSVDKINHATIFEYNKSIVREKARKSDN